MLPYFTSRNQHDIPRPPRQGWHSHRETRIRSISRCEDPISGDLGATLPYSGHPTMPYLQRVDYIFLCLCGALFLFTLLLIFHTCLYLICYQTLDHMIKPKPRRRGGGYAGAAFVVLVFLYLHQYSWHLTPLSLREPSDTIAKANTGVVYNTTLGVSLYVDFG